MFAHDIPRDSFDADTSTSGASDMKNDNPDTRPASGDQFGRTSTPARWQARTKAPTVAPSRSAASRAASTASASWGLAGMAAGSTSRPWRSASRISRCANPISPLVSGRGAGASKSLRGPPALGEHANRRNPYLTSRARTECSARRQSLRSSTTDPSGRTREPMAWTSVPWENMR